MSTGTLRDLSESHSSWRGLSARRRSGRGRGPDRRAAADQPGRYRLDAHGHRARAADDAGAGVLLRRPRPIEERAQHDDDELRVARLRRRPVGPVRLFARVWPGRARGWAITSRFFLRGVGLEAQGTIPHALFMAYQGTFAIITAALISGAIVERMRFSAYVLFISSVGARRLQPDRALGLGRRLARDARRARLRRRNRRARQRRRRGAGRGHRRREAPGISVGVAAAAPHPVHAARRRPAVVRLVRLQCRQRARRPTASRGWRSSRRCSRRPPRSWSGPSSTRSDRASPRPSAPRPRSSSVSSR